MKKSLLVLLALSILASTYAQFNPNSGAAGCSKRKSQWKSLPTLKSSEAFIPHSFNVIKYTLDIDLFKNHLSPYPNDFTANMTVKFMVDSVLNSITLNAGNPSLQINAVSLAGTSFTHANDLLHITLDRTYIPGDIVEVGIKYKHLNIDDFGFYANGGFVFTDSEPEGARRWMPCYDKPSDKAQWELKAKVHKNVKLGSNGILADSVVVADTLWYTWASYQNVATYLMIITSKMNYNLDIVNWVHPNNPQWVVPMRFYYNNGEQPQPMEAIIGDMTTFYSETFCDHPFSKNGFATLNDEFSWGGMENQTLTSLCPGCWSEYLVAHEFAHQWFGDMITCATWADLWLNEGFATFSEALWAEHTIGYSGYKNEIQGDAAYYLQANPEWPISDPAWAVTTPEAGVLFNYAVTYCKGACVLHLLRYTIGDSAFFQVLNQYAADTNLKYKSAVIPDFIQHVNTVTGQDYQWFFDQWIYQANHPVYENNYYFQNMGNGQWKISFTVHQVQTNAGFFKMPIEIRVLGLNGLDTTFKVMNEYNDQGFEFFINKQPSVIYFDQMNQIVLKEASLTVGLPETTIEGFMLEGPTPNPASNQTYFDVNLPKPANLQIAVYNLLGGEAMNESRWLDAGKGRISLATAGLRNGVYMVRITAGQQQLVRRLVINR